MKVGLIDVDSKIPNLALMKLAAFHRQNGDDVEFYRPLMRFSYDKVYASQIFTSSSRAYVPPNAILGGSGASITTTLPAEVEHIYPDYGLYGINYAMGYITRGCMNRCPFCIVWKKEGFLRKVAPLEEFWRHQTHVRLLDNSITDLPEGVAELEKMGQYGLKVDITQGINVRTLTKEGAAILAQLRLWRGLQWKIAWDNPTDESQVIQGINVLFAAGVKPHQIMCYVLVGFNTSQKQDLHRIYVLDKMGVDPFVMAYRKSPYTRALGKWCNRKPIMKSCTFEEFTQARTNRGEIYATAP